MKIINNDWCAGCLMFGIDRGCCEGQRTPTWIVWFPDSVDALLQSQRVLMHYYNHNWWKLNLRQCRCIITISKSVHALLQAQRVLMNYYNNKWCKINLRQCRCIITILKSVDAFSLSQMKKNQPQPISMLYQNLKSQSQRVLMHNHIIKSWLKQSTINIAVHHKDKKLMKWRLSSFDI